MCSRAPVRGVGPESMRRADLVALAVALAREALYVWPLAVDRHDQAGELAPEAGALTAASALPPQAAAQTTKARSNTAHTLPTYRRPNFLAA
jgi:hypothetical protein